MIKNEASNELEKTFAELYISSAINLKNSIINIANFYDKKCNFIRKQICILENEEPLKFFKKSHKNWEDKLHDLSQKYDDAFTKFIEECKELESIMEILTFKSKKYNEK